ncbi:CCA tRNA nucleotidyltransferase 1, mitochondrial [Patella vulgata]|uniref:CCA tRNA nucleotidyltransferase 1, mitochondrial n=1 Tax=Patella vulgata TaxID=6465 RepID=UPI0024A7F0D0|nr:CCA tRNA nucleotidyltransferase 1, mitochondrial [Patella vulgata]
MNCYIFRRGIQQIITKTKQFKNIHRTFAYRREGKLVTMKLDTPLFQNLFTPEMKQLVEIFNRHGHELRIAGGAVRDLIMDKLPVDIDFATTATPDQMKELFENEKIRLINNKGEKHGTITARINDKENFEVTTLRIDVVTDGRHAEVQFTRDWQLDANRRDLTINAMFLGFDGTLYDYFHGREDLDQRKVKFVGNPEARIQEDYLRILRYFRFYGRIASNPNSHDAETLEAIRNNSQGLAGISGERIWMELRKIITGNYADYIMETMMSLGLTPYMGLPDKCNIKEFQRICQLTEGLSPLPMTRLSALLEDENQVYEVDQRLKLSKEEIRLALFIIDKRSQDFEESVPLKYFSDLIVDAKEPKMKERILELIKYKGDTALLRTISEWSPPKFPITGHDLTQKNVPKGPIFAKTLNELRNIWKERGYQITKEELLLELDRIVTQLGL